MKVRSLVTATLLAISLGIFSANARAAGRDGGHDDNEVKFQGTIESLPSTPGFIGDWRVSGKTVHVTSSTHIENEHGSIAVGVAVKVEGQARSDGSIDASDIEALESGEGGDDGGDDAGHVDFSGSIQSLPGAAPFIGDWHVGGRTIHVTAATQIDTEHGPVTVGALVEVEGARRADGSIDATKIEVKSNPAGDDGRDELKGTIDKLPASGLIGDWSVAGRIVHVTAATHIDTEHGAAAVGASVEVSGTLRADGSLDATKIEVQSGATGGDDHGEGQSSSFKGAIQRLPSSSDFTGDWLIEGRTVHVVSSTRLKGEHGVFAVGTRVKVKGIQMADGTTVASKIQVKDN
jgi:uncharacterized protein DUF5666